MRKSAYVYQLMEEVFAKLKIEENKRVMITDCWMEQGDGVHVKMNTKIEMLWQENHCTHDCPLKLRLPPLPTLPALPTLPPPGMLLTLGACAGVTVVIVCVCVSVCPRASCYMPRL